MSLVIDSSRSFRSPLEVTGLVQAILGASPNDESDWVEWKNGALMLGQKAAYFAIARHILGMANRLPEDAMRHAEGCGYIVVGAEPGQCQGVTEIDPADLDAGIRPYLGSEGPRWSAQYVKPQPHGGSVLVVTIEPPRRGDPIFTLQKEYDKYLAGVIFVRRPGRTDQAGPGDVRSLTDRYAAANHSITLHVRPTGTDDSLSIPVDANHTQLFEAWEAQARTGLLSLSPPAETTGDFRIADTFREDLDRKYDEYRAKVERYLKECRACYLKSSATLAAQGGDKLTRLSLVNTSDRNYTDIRIEIRIQAPFMYVQDPDKLTDPPKRPEVPRMPDKRGIRQMTSFPYDIFDYYPSLAKVPAIPAPPKFEVTRTAISTVVTYEIARIRPEQQIPLDPVLILAIDQPGGELEITWRVTVGNVDGVVEGNLSATKVAPEWADRLNPELIFGQPWKSRGSEGKRGFRAELGC